MRQLFNGRKEYIIEIRWCFMWFTIDDVYGEELIFDSLYDANSYVSRKIGNSIKKETVC